MGLGVQRKAQCLSFGEHFGRLWVGWRGETASEEGLFSDVLSLQGQLRKEMAAKAPCLVRVPGSPGALCTSHGSPGPPWTQQPVCQAKGPCVCPEERLGRVQRSLQGESCGSGARSVRDQCQPETAPAPVRPELPSDFGAWGGLSQQPQKHRRAERWRAQCH